MRIDSVPKAMITMIGGSMQLRSPDELAEHIVAFGGLVLDELRSGSIVTMGNQYLGFRDASVTARGPLETMDVPPQMQKSIIIVDEMVNIDDITVQRILVPASKFFGLAKPEYALNRFANWFWVGTQVAWMCNPLFVMNHHKKYWRELCYQPIWDARFRFYY